MRAPNFFVCLLGILVIVFAGCESGGCIKVGGSYQGVAGDVEYCFNGKGTGAPAFTETTEDGTEKEFFGFTEDQLNGILEKITDIGGQIGVLSVKKADADQGEPVHPATRILEVLKE